MKNIQRATQITPCYFALQYARLINYQLSLRISVVAKAVLRVRSMLFFEVDRSRAPRWHLFVRVAEKKKTLV